MSEYSSYTHKKVEGSTTQWWSEASKLSLFNTKDKYFPKLYEWRKTLDKSAFEHGDCAISKGLWAQLWMCRGHATNYGIEGKESEVQDREILPTTAEPPGASQRDPDKLTEHSGHRGLNHCCIWKRA